MHATFDTAIERAERCLATGDWPIAQDLLDEIEAHFGPSSRLLNARGVLAANLGDPGAAMKAFRDALALDGRNITAVLNMARLLAAGGHPDQGKGLAERGRQLAAAADDVDGVAAADQLLAELSAPPPPPPTPGSAASEGPLALLGRFAEEGIDQLGLHLEGEEWIPWVRLEGITFFNLPLSAMVRMRPQHALPRLIQLGWKQTMHDIRFRYRATTRPNPPHLLHPIGPGQTVVELGAYLGHYTLFAAKAVGPTGRVVAVEFIPENYEILKLNLEQNFPETATALNYGVWSGPGTKTAYRQALQANAFDSQVLTGAFDGVEVPTESVDNLLEAQGIEHVDLLIVTINGAEVEAFKGMTRSLSKIGAFAIAARYGEGDEDRVKTVCDWLVANGYAPEIVSGDHVYAPRATP